MKKIFKQMLEISELPADAAINAPYITLEDNNCIIIENHKGIKSFTADEIRIKLKSKYIAIYGSGLYIKCITNERIEIKGHIYDVKYFS